MTTLPARRLVRVSKWLALHLRHRPERIGIRLDPAGWVAVDDLLAAARASGFPLSRWQLDEVVAGNDKGRYELDAEGRRIRARQGHTVPVDLGLVPVDPPPVLYHGTVEAALAAIGAEGLRPMGRHHVHLSPDVPTATAVGRRRGAPVVLEVEAAAMAVAGHLFYLTGNQVWLTARVPPEFLRRRDQGPPPSAPSPPPPATRGGA